jgi:hypothetical protein
MNLYRTFLRGCVVAAAAAASSLAPTGTRAENLENYIGAAHIAPLYSFGTKDSLNQGADEVVAMGCHVIKVELSGSTPTKYPFHSTWPAFTDLKSVALTSYFQTLFANPNIDTYVLTCYCPHITGNPKGGPADYWYYGSGQTAQFNDEQTQFQNFAAYLLGNPAYAGKTFILENWEGDSALAAEAANAGQTGNVPWSAKDGMVTWANARLAGIHAAKVANPNSQVHVYGGFECNNIKYGMFEAGIGPNANQWNGTVVPTYPWTTVVDVIPNLRNLERLSYSCYDTNFIAPPNAYDTQAAVDFMVSKSPGLTYAQCGIGETGVNILKPTDPATTTSDINNVLSVVINNSMAYMLYWELYNNESGKGFWMIKSDGTPDVPWHLWRWQTTTTSNNRATTAEIKAGCTLKYTSAFPSSGSSLGTGWSTTTASGAISWTCQAGNLVNMKILNGSTTPYGLATLNVTTVAGRALDPGDYVEYSVKRLQSAGIIGTSAFNANHGSAISPGSQPLQVYSNGWTPISWWWDGTHPAYNWDATATLGLRLDSADGTFATISYYFNGNYAGSWIYQTTATSLNTVSLFAQDSGTNDQFQFGNVQVWFAN